jgi:hypothetical protein
MSVNDDDFTTTGTGPAAEGPADGGAAAGSHDDG